MLKVSLEPDLQEYFFRKQSLIGYFLNKPIFTRYLPCNGACLNISINNINTYLFRAIYKNAIQLSPFCCGGDFPVT